MAIKVKFATFTKRENSTAQYSGTWTDYDCLLKDDCSVMFPKIELHTATAIHNFNYASIPDFNRFYFITDVTFSRGFYIVSMKCDVLATYKSTIGSSTEYVLRSSSNYDGEIIDTLYPAKSTTTVTKTGYHSSPFDAANITSIVGFLNCSARNKFGAVEYLTMSDSSLQNMMKYLLGSTLAGGSDDILNDLAAFLLTITDTDIKNGITRSLIDPAQYITESYRLPYAPDTSSGPAVRAICGWYRLPSNCVGHVVTGGGVPVKITDFDLTFPTHPQATTRGDFLNLSPYSSYWLSLGSFGIYPIDSTLVYAATSRQINVEVFGDMQGNVYCKLKINGEIIDILHGNVKVNFPVGQTTMDVSRAIGSVGQVGVALAESATPVGAVAAVGAIASATEAAMPKSRTSGNVGTFSNVFDDYYAYGQFHEVVDEDLAQRGRPLCKAVQISTLSGYILVNDPDVSIAGTKEENQQIKSYMSNGFYYE